MPPGASIFDRNLSDTITLADGTKVKTLDDARTLLDVFGSVNARSARSFTASDC